jgi:hypothetical protein
MKTVWDPTKRVYRNMPTAVQPPQQPKKWEPASSLAPLPNVMLA